MKNTCRGFTLDYFIRRAARKLAVVLILALIAPALLAQQTEKRILVDGEKKTDAAKKQDGPRAQKPELVLQTGVTDPIAIMSFSPDGALLATMSFYGGAIKLWDSATGRELMTINLGDRGSFTFARNSDFRFSADGSILSVFGGVLKQWDARTGKQIRSLSINKGEDSAVSISPDGRLLVTINNAQQSLVVRDTATGRQVQAITGDINSTTFFHATAFSPDGRTLATGEETRGEKGDATTLTLRDVASWRVARTIKISEENLKDMRNLSASSTQPIRTIRFSPDGRAVAMSMRDMISDTSIGSIGSDARVLGRENTIKVWDAATGRDLREIKVADPVSSRSQNFTAEYSFAFSPDSRQCASASNDSSVKLFDTATGRNFSTLAGHTGEVLSLAFSADGRQMATASVDNTIKIWDVSNSVATGRADLLRTLGSAAMPVETLAFGADGRALAVAGAQAVNVWEMPTGAALRTITLPLLSFEGGGGFAERLPRAFLSANGQMAATVTNAGEVKLSETRTGREVKTFATKNVSSGSISPDGKLLAVIDRAGSSTQPAPSPQAPQNPAQTAPQPPAPTDPKAQKDKNKKQDPRKQMEEMQREMMKQMEQMQKANKGKPGNPQVAMPNPDQIQKILDAAQRGEMGKVQEVASEMAGSLAPGLAGKLTGPVSSVRLLDVGTGNEVRAMPAQSGFGVSGEKFVAFSPDGRLLASAPGGRSIKINETSTGRDVFTLAPDRGFLVNGMAWSPDGRMFATGNMEAKSGLGPGTKDFSFDSLYVFNIRLWDLSDAAGARELRTMTGLSGRVTAIAFSPDSRLIASGGDNAQIKLWEAATGREVLSFTGHTLPINALAFSPDGKLIASGSQDGSTRVWDVQAGQLLCTLVSVNQGADWLVVTPDGLFDGTPGAWNQILWRFSPDVFDVAPVEVFFNEFFYPGLLADIHAGKRPRAEKDVSQKDRRQPVVTLSRADGQTSNVATRTITVRVAVGEPQSSGATTAGARDVRLFRNGTLVKVWRGDVLKGQKQTVLEATVPIVAGENRLTAYAFNRDNVKSPDAMLAVTGAQELQRKGTLYILAFGVNRYANEQYNLKYAVADAASFAEEVRAQQSRLQNYERVEVVELLDREATKENILLALKRLSSSSPPVASSPAALAKIQPVRPEDAVAIYFAGHGTAQGARFYLVPHDLGYAGARNAIDAAAVKMILAHSISDLELEAAFEGIDAGQMLMVIDACNSGQALEAEEKRRGPMNSKGLAQLAYEKGMYILTAAQSYQAALEAAELGHGYLTFALVEEGLKKGAADRDAKDGQVVAREWFNYASERVPQMQEKELKARLLLQQDVSFVEGEEKIKDPTRKSVQRPRVFYRRELESRPLIIARP